MANKKQNGFTMIELLVVMAIIGILSAGAAMTFDLVMKTSSTAMEQTRGLGEVHMAGNWISRDMKNAVGTVVSTTGNTLCSMLCSVGVDFATDNVTYVIDTENHILTRSSKRVGSSDPATVMTVARFIVGPGADTTFFSSENITSKYFKLKVTSDYDPSIPGSVSGVYKIARGYY
jgi:prepilin-type N-terminal cleavage/methylation domain-containing protein